MPRIPQYNQQTSAPAGFKDSSVRAPQTGNMIAGVADAASGMIRQQQAVDAANDDFRARRLSAYDQQQDQLRMLEAKEIADGKAADIQLAKLTEFNALKNSIGPDQDFAQEWELRRKQMDEGEIRTLQTSNKYAPQLLREKLEGQRLSFGVQAIAESEKLMSVNAEYRFNKKSDTIQKTLMQLDGKTGDAELLRLNQDLTEDGSLAKLSQAEADALQDKAMDQYSRTVGERMLVDPDLAKTMYSAIYGVSGYDAPKIRAREDGSISYSGLKVSPAKGKWDAIIAREANAQGVSPDLVAAVVQQESGGKTHGSDGKPITSYSGAVGLMQLMPATARALGVSDSADAVQNIRGGTKLLATLSKKYNGDTAKVLAAYNAGEKVVDKAIAKNPVDWRGAMRQFQGIDKKSGTDNFKQTQEYIDSISAMLGPDGVVATGEPTPAPYLNILQFANPETLKYLGDSALRVIAQNERTKREMSKVELNARIDAEKTAAADGKPIQNPLTEADWIRAGEKPDDAAIKYQNHKFTQDVAPVIGELSKLSKFERDSVVRMSDPGEGDAADITYGARKDAYKLAQAANERIDAQIKEDPAGSSTRMNPAVARAKENFDTISRIQGANPAAVADARRKYVAATTSWQRDQGVESPAIMTAQEVANVRSQWAGQPDGPAKAAEVMVSMARSFGESYPLALKQISKDLPSEALWVGNLADAPGMDGVRTQMAAASKAFVDLKTIPQRSAVEKAIDANFANFSASMTSTNPLGGQGSWARLKDGAVKYAAIKIAQSGADPETAAKQAFDELVASQYIFTKSNQTVGTIYSNGTDLEAVTSDVVLRIPRTWPGQIAGQTPESILPGAEAWRRAEIDGLKLMPTGGRSERVYMADVKQKSRWVTSPDEDGLQLMLGQDVVRDQYGKPVRVSWTNAADMNRARPARPLVQMDPRARAAAKLLDLPRAIGDWFVASDKN